MPHLYPRRSLQSNWFLKKKLTLFFSFFPSFSFSFSFTAISFSSLSFFTFSFSLCSLRSFSFFSNLMKNRNNLFRPGKHQDSHLSRAGLFSFSLVLSLSCSPLRLLMSLSELSLSWDLRALSLSWDLLTLSLSWDCRTEALSDLLPGGPMSPFLWSLSRLSLLSRPALPLLALSLLSRPLLSRSLSRFFSLEELRISPSSTTSAPLSFSTLAGLDTTSVSSLDLPFICERNFTIDSDYWQNLPRGTQIPSSSWTSWQWADLDSSLPWCTDLVFSPSHPRTPGELTTYNWLVGASNLSVSPCRFSFQWLWQDSELQGKTGWFWWGRWDCSWSERSLCSPDRPPEPWRSCSATCDRRACNKLRLQ